MTKFHQKLAAALELRHGDLGYEDAEAVVVFFEKHGWTPPEGSFRIVEVESTPLGYEVEDKRQAGDPLVAAFTTRREAEAWVKLLEDR